MHRIRTQRQAEHIAVALTWIPDGILPLIEGTDFLVGVDPIFAGLHDFETTFDGRSYRQTAHCVYGYHQEHLAARHRKTTVAIPEGFTSTAVIVHELGHALDEVLDFSVSVNAISKYAETDRYEAFAEAFVAYCELPEYIVERKALLKQPTPFVALLDGLSSN